MRVAVALGTLLAVIAGRPAQSDTLRYTAQLASDVATPQPSAAAGKAALSLDTATKTISWIIEYSGLPQAAKAAGCGALEASSGPSIQLTGNLASPIKGSKTLTDSEIATLRAGHWVCLVSIGDDAELGGQLQPAP